MEGVWWGVSCRCGAGLRVYDIWKCFQKIGKGGQCRIGKLALGLNPSWHKKQDEYDYYLSYAHTRALLPQAYDCGHFNIVEEEEKGVVHSFSSGLRFIFDSSFDPPSSATYKHLSPFRESPEYYQRTKTSKNGTRAECIERPSNM